MKMETLLLTKWRSLILWDPLLRKDSSSSSYSKEFRKIENAEEEKPVNFKID